MHARTKILNRTGLTGGALVACVAVALALGFTGPSTIAPSAAAQAVDGPFDLVPIQQIGGASHAVVAQYEAAFVGLGPRVVAVDVSGDEPHLWGQTDVLPGVVQSLAMHGGHVYAAYQAGAAIDRRSGVAAVLVSDPATPVIVSVVPQDVGYASISAGDGVLVAVGFESAWTQSRGVVDVFDAADPTALRRASRVPLQGGAAAVTMHGDRAYVLEARPDGRSTAVRVLDVSDPDRVTKATVASVLGDATAIATDGRHLFVAGDEEAVSIVDADPAGLGLIGRLALEPHDACASTLSLRDDTLLVGDRCTGAMHFVGVSNPLAPRLYHTLDLGVLPGAIANGPFVAPYGDDLYVSSGPAGGLLTVRISPGRAPRVVGELHAMGAASGLEVVDGELYTVHRDVGLTATDLEGGRAQGAAFATTVPLADARDVLASHGRLYVAGGEEHVVHVLPPRTPSVESARRDDYWRVTIDGAPLQQLVRDDTLFVAAADGGVRALDLADPERPVEVGHYGPHGAWQLTSSDDVLYMVGTLSWMFLLDPSDPSNLRELGKINADASTRIARAIAADGDTAYVALTGLDIVHQVTHDRLRAIDASDPSAPVELTSYDGKVPSRPRRATVHADELFVAGDDGLTVVQLPATDEATVLAEWASRGLSQDVRVYEGVPGSDGRRHAYVADGDGGVQVFAIEEPGRPVLTPAPTRTPPEQVPTQEPTPLATRPAPEWPAGIFLPTASKGSKLPSGAVDLRFAGSVGGASLGLDLVWPHVYRGDGPHLVTLDVSDPGTIREVGRSETLPGIVTDVTVAGDMAYVAASESGLLVLDLSDPVHAKLVSQARTPDAALDVAAVGGFVVVAARDAGLLAFDVADPRDPRLVDRLPLPGLTELVRAHEGHAIVQSGGRTHVVSVGDDGGLEMVTDLVDEDCAEGTRGLALDGDRAYVGQCWLEIAVFDLGEIEQPVHLGTTTFPRTHTHVLAAGEGLVFAISSTSDRGEVHTIDAADPTSLQLVGSAETLGPPLYLAVTDGQDEDAPPRQAVIGTSAGHSGRWDDPDVVVRGALQVVDAGVPADPRVIGTSWIHAAPIFGAEPVGSYLYARIAEPEGTWSEYALSRVALVDVSTPGHPTMAGLLEAPRDANDLAVRGDMAYVGSTDGWFEMYDVTEATAPARTGRYQVARVPVTIALQDEGPVFAAYVEYDTENRGTITVCVVDVSDPRIASVVSRVRVPGRLTTMAAADGHAYLGVTDGLENLLVDVDATAPASARVVSSTSFFQNPAIPALAARGDLVFAAFQRQGVSVLDLSDRSGTRIVGEIDTAVETQLDGLVWTDDDRLVVAGQGGVEVFDVEEPSRPIALDHEYAPPYLTLGRFFALSPLVAQEHVYAVYGTADDTYLGLAAIRME